MNEKRNLKTTKSICDLSRFKKEKPVARIGKSGKEYAPYDNYTSASEGSGFDKGKIQLPLQDYPYTVRYETKFLFECCNNCDCCEKY